MHLGCIWHWQFEHALLDAGVSSFSQLIHEICWTPFFLAAGAADSRTDLREAAAEGGFGLSFFDAEEGACFEAGDGFDTMKIS